MLLLRLSLLALLLRANPGSLATANPLGRRQNHRWLLVVFDDGNGKTYQVSVQANTPGVQTNNSMVVSQVSLHSGPIAACTVFGINGSMQEVAGGAPAPIEPPQAQYFVYCAASQKGGFV
ncbi:hypothetical protein PG991_006276 [Apiospora marii]|uniref:Secreted protein n=1 Tax=Apiospora marii TaxID=335849 RepID=A0ABR1SCV9_9PEZI